MPQMNTASLFTQSSADNTPSERRRQLARLLLARGLDDSPIQHPTQGAARMAHALIAGLEMRAADEAERQQLAAKALDPRYRLPGANPATAAAQAAPKVDGGFSLASLLSGLVSGASSPSAPIDPDNIGAGAAPSAFAPPEVAPPPVMAAPQLPPQALSLAPANQPIAPQIIPPQVAPPQRMFNPLDPNMMELERPNAPVRDIGTPPPVSPQEYINRGWDDMYGRAPKPEARPRPRDDADAVTNAETPQDYINRAWGGLTPQGRDIATRTVLGEAANQGQTGMNAVADVMRNRAQSGRYGGDTMDQVALARKQFEPWMTQAGRDRMAAYSPTGAPYQAAQASVDTAAIGSRPDVTGNAQYFYAPKAQAALAPVDGRPVVPSFARGQEPSAVIGDHNFYQERSRLAQANPQAALPPQAQLAQQQPAPSQVAQPQSLPQPVSKFGPGVTNEQMRTYADDLISKGLRFGNGAMVKEGRDIIDKINAPSKYHHVPQKDGSVLLINENDPNDRRLVSAGNQQAIIEFEARKAAAEKLASETAKDRAEAITSYNSLASKMPGVEKVVTQLDGLAGKATYTLAGQAVDAVRRQTGLEPREAAIARAQYTATVDNQVLPLLRDTFGAQFTQKEGETLRSTLGDPDKSPMEKQAILRSFIEQKRRDIEAMAVRAGIAPTPERQANPAPQPGVIRWERGPDGRPRRAQ